jgi:spore germination protein YaaH
MKTIIAIFLISVASLFSQVTIPAHYPNRCIVTNTVNVLPNISQIPNNEPLKKEVMGWHPYWAGANAHTTYDYTVLNHLSYFGYELETDGSLKSYQSAVSDSAVIAYAKEQGCRTSVTIICFDAAIFSAVMDDEEKYTLFQNEIIELVERLEVDEVIFDFEPLSTFPQEKIRDFSLDMKFALFVVPSVELISISIAMPAVDWNNSINLEHYSLDFDKLIVMAYDYYWRNSPIAGPVSPLKGENKNVQNTISTYLQDVPKEQLIIAFPWYGYDWPVNSTQRKATATGSGTARTLSEMVNYTSENTPTFDITTQVPWLNYTNAQIQRQIWYEDSLSLSYKYAEIRLNDLAGVGIWALNYANGLDYVWSEIRKQFEQTTTTISANQEIVEFKGVQIETTSSQTITLTNTGNSVLQISDITTVGSDSAVYSISEGKPSSTSISIAPNDSIEFTVQFAPLVVKSYNNARIVVVSNAANSLEIPLTGEGVPITSVRNNIYDENLMMKLLGQNPITSESIVELTVRKTVKGVVDLLIIDTSGATVQSIGIVKVEAGTTLLPFTVSNLASGAYTIVAKIDGYSFTLPMRIVR